MHTLKEQTLAGVSKTITFPVVLETSDNLWMGKASMQTSTAAFSYYVVEEMSYEDGKREMVTKYQLFDDSLYKTMYNSFRGHTRFYTFTWQEMFKGNREYNDTLNDLINESRVLIEVCLLQCTNQSEAAITFLKKLQLKKFAMKEFEVTHINRDIVTQLIKCNLLYYNLKTGILHVQNSLLEIALSKIL